MNRQIKNRLAEIARKLKKEYKAERVILYGSYASGEERKGSDIDLLVIAPCQERFFERMATVRALIRDLRKGLPVSPLVLTSAEIQERLKFGEQFIKEILEKGLSL